MEKVSKWNQFRRSPLTSVFIVFIAMFLDGALLTTVVPIIPEKIKDIKITNWDLLHGENKDQYSIWTLSVRKDVNLTEMENQFATETYLDGSGMGYEIDIPYFENRTDASGVDLKEDNFMVGVILAAKAITQSIFNCFIGSITIAFGYQRPMFFGFLMTIGSTILFAFSESAAMMLVSRAIQGIGTSFSTVSGLGLLAFKFQDGQERGHYLALAFTGFGLGVLIGPPFGSVVFQFFGVEVPFYILAGIGAFDGLIQLLTYQPNQTDPAASLKKQESTSFLELLSDPYIMLTSVTMASANICIAFLETGLPIWMIEAGSEKWMLGMPLLAMNVTFILTNNLAPVLSKHIGNWAVIGLGLFLSAISMIVMPFSYGSYLDGMFKLFGPCMVLGIGCALVDVGVLSSMGTLVDTRHTPVYGTVFAISDMALCVAFALGPLSGGAIIEVLNFEYLLLICGVINLAIIPFCYFLRDPPVRNRIISHSDDCEPILDRESIRSEIEIGAECPSGRYGRFRSLSKVVINPT